MKVYLIKDEDIDMLKAELSRDPRHGSTGGSSQVLTEIEEKAFEKAHRFYWYTVTGWINKIKQD